MPAHAFGIHHPALRQIRQLQVFQEQVDELFARQSEAEIVLPLAVRTTLRAAAALTTLRAGDGIAFDVLLVAWQQMIAHAARGATVERRLVHALRGQGDLACLIRIFNGTSGRALVHSLADKRLRTAHEPLSVGEVLPARVQASVNDMHEIPVPAGPLITPPA